MDQVRAFYVTLPSDKSHVGNSLHTYRVQLPETVHLEGVWEVALSQIVYPVTYHTLYDTSFHFRTWLDKKQKPLLIGSRTNPKAAFKRLGSATLEPNHYSDAGVVVENLNHVYRDFYDKFLWSKNDTPNPRAREVTHLMTEWRKHINFSYNKKSQRVTVELDDAVKYLLLEEGLSYALGFETGLFKRAGSHVAKYPPDVMGAVRNLWVYLDIIQPQLVGGVRTPLLKILPISGRYPEETVLDINTLEFVPLLVNDFDSLKIHIKDFKGRPVQFMFGSVIVKLYFRRRSLL